MTLHRDLAAGRWQSFDLPEQLANVGSEVDRAILAWQSGRSDRFDRALDRALELFDLTARDERWRGPRLREILRAREEFVRVFHGGAPGSAEGLRRYFLAFATLTQSRRSRRATAAERTSG
jgi:hypothetical protein